MIKRKNKYDFDLIVLGSGSAGGVAAQKSVRLGKRVALVEPAQIGGECPNIGCVPTKSLLYAAGIYDAAVHGQDFGINGDKLKYDYPEIKAWKDLAVHRTGTWQGKEVFESIGIEVIKGAAQFVSSHEIAVEQRRFTSKNFLIATGTHNFIPPVEGLEDTGYITYEQAINFEKPPKSIFICGGGPIGCEFAELFSIFGAEVYLCDITPRLLMREDEDISELAKNHFENDRGVKVFTDTEVTRVAKERGGKRVFYLKDGKHQSVLVEEIMFATGKRANVDIGLEKAGVEYTSHAVAVNAEMQTSAKNIWAAGDVVGPYQFTHMAEYQSRLAVNNMWHRKKIMADYRAVPRCIFITPEVASVGASESDCGAAKMKYKVGKAPLSLIGRSNTSNFEDGFVKVITRQDGVIIGASIACPSAGEMIHELTLAIQQGLTAKQVAETIHAFPTWSEAIRIACAKIS